MLRPQVVAHRGSSARYADNSWPAFEAAASEGADAIECDVQATRDRVIVVRHDLAIDDRLVADLCLAEIEARAPGTVVLADLLAFAESSPIDLLVEIKDPHAADAVAQMIAASARRDRIVVGSFHGPALAAVKATAPDAANLAHDGQRRRARRADPACRRISRRWRTPLLGSARSPPASIARTEQLSTGCGTPDWRSRCGTRNAKTNCARWWRSSPMPSAPIPRRS